MAQPTEPPPPSPPPPPPPPGLEPTCRDHDGDTTAPDTPTNLRPPCFKSTLHEVLFVLTATMAIAQGSLLGAPSPACALTNGAFLLFFGKVADLFGRKILFVASLLLFAVFSLAAGFARSGLVLDLLNGFIGLTCASAIPPAAGLLGVIYDRPSPRKNYAFACFSAGNPLGFVFGTIFGGLATSLGGWRASFYLMAIIFLLFTLIGLATIPPDPAPHHPWNLHTLHTFDLPGTLLMIFGIGMFSAALSLGSTAPHGWTTPYVLALLLVGLALILAFVAWDTHYPHPLVPMTIWRDRNFSLCLVIMMLGFMAFTPGVFFIALYLQDAWRLSALMVAVRLLPMAVVGFLVNTLAGLTLHRISNKLLMLIGAAAYTVGFLLAALNTHSSSYWAFLFPSFILLVIGADLEFNVANMYVMSSMPAHQQSIAGGIFQTAAKLCMTLGFGIATAIFNSAEPARGDSPYWDRETRPYSAVFWFACATSAASVALVPFLTLGTQGAKKAEVVAVREDDDRQEKSGAEASVVTGVEVGT
ncbi:Major Facilitator Superfamily [Teratosphaeria destructans]|uniref:Major Facilitator Superfamily n=1 Tax=Teratosphaeria destructans TaxID=418781 RepID=A0A9W7SVD5_9PEZI|nr:Major Facilitator Superfamily [Teratosphaeria destructans]